MSTNPFEEIDALLRDVSRELPCLPDWAAAFSKLSAASSDDERLAVYQAVRDEGCFEREAGQYLLCWAIDAILTRLVDAGGETLEERAARLDAACEQGLLGKGKSRLLRGPRDAESLRPFEAAMRRGIADPGPIAAEEVEALDAWRARFLKQLRALGEGSLADQLWRHPLYFARDVSHGARQLFDPSAEAARRRASVQTIFHQVTECIDSDSEDASFRRRWYQEASDAMRIDVYPTPIELLGGPADGRLVDAEQIRFDLVSIGNIFDPLRRLEWEVEGGERHSDIVAEGEFERFDVELCLRPTSPYDEKAVLKKDSASYFNPLGLPGIDDIDLKFDDDED